jgi:hypothetical protein
LQGHLATCAIGANPVINVSVYPFCAIPSKRERKGVESVGQKMPTDGRRVRSAMGVERDTARKTAISAPGCLPDG